MHLLLVRHGQSYVNLDDWDQGYIDTGLTPLGQQQAARVAAWMAENFRVDAVYTSTMRRTLETAAFLEAALERSAERDDRLREFGNCYADGEAVAPDDMPVLYAEFWGTERPYTPISARGESWMLFRLRVGRFLDDVLARHSASDPDTTVVIVCHGGVIDAVFDYVFNIGAQRQVEVWTHNTGIVHFEHRPESTREVWRLHAHGLVHHLSGENGEWFGSAPMLRNASAKLLPGALLPDEKIKPE